MRLPEVDREELVGRSQQIFDEIVASRGFVRGPFAALMHSPEVAGRAANLGAYLRFETSLDPKTLQIVTLAVAREWDCQYEWTAHEPQAREALVPEDVITAIKERRAPEGLSEDEALLVRYVHELLRDHRVAPETFDRIQSKFSSLELTDLTTTIGYYSMLACALIAYEVQPAEGVVPLLPL